MGYLGTFLFAGRVGVVGGDETRCSCASAGSVKLRGGGRWPRCGVAGAMKRVVGEVRRGGALTATGFQEGKGWKGERPLPLGMGMGRKVREGGQRREERCSALHTHGVVERRYKASLPGWWTYTPTSLAGVRMRSRSLPGRGRTGGELRPLTLHVQGLRQPLTGRPRAWEAWRWLQ